MSSTVKGFLAALVLAAFIMAFFGTLAWQADGGPIDFGCNSATAGASCASANMCQRCGVLVCEGGVWKQEHVALMCQSSSTQQDRNRHSTPTSKSRK